jgi:hypothetical protein
MNEITTGSSRKSPMPAANGSCQPLRRVNYFPGQILAADDFQAEQDYLLEKHRRHNLRCHGFGVVQGLEVSVTRGNADWTVVVNPGFTIDRIGNELQLCAGVRLGLGATGSPVYVAIGFMEVPSEPVPVPGGPVADPAAAVVYRRIEEGSDVFLSANAGSPTLALARLVRRGQTWRLDRTFKVARTR